MGLWQVKRIGAGILARPFVLSSIRGPIAYRQTTATHTTKRRPQQRQGQARETGARHRRLSPSPRLPRQGGGVGRHARSQVKVVIDTVKKTTLRLNYPDKLLINSP